MDHVLRNLVGPKCSEHNQPWSPVTHASPSEKTKQPLWSPCTPCCCSDWQKPVNQLGGAPSMQNDQNAASRFLRTLEHLSNPSNDLKRIRGVRPRRLQSGQRSWRKGPATTSRLQPSHDINEATNLRSKQVDLSMQNLYVYIMSYYLQIRVQNQ